ncbi:MAG: hypothetical protein LBE12_09150 [Planctomycetaceae bacterium]|nr:hypothetical protein [Planctomycetaceae bacterium]
MSHADFNRNDCKSLATLSTIHYQLLSCPGLWVIGSSCSGGCVLLDRRLGTSQP